MAYTRTKTVSFGSSNTGLTTVGYALIDNTGVTIQARTTSGVTEVLDGNGDRTGSYTAIITFPDYFYGNLIWDTGAGQSATEEINRIRGGVPSE